MSDHVAGIAIGLGIRAGHDPEVSRFGIDGVQPAILARVQPSDIIADRPDFPALVAGRGDQHGQIGLAAGGGECASQIVNLALRVLDADNEHMLRQPAFGARLPAGDA